MPTLVRKLFIFFKYLQLCAISFVVFLRQMSEKVKNNTDWKYTSGAIIFCVLLQQHQTVLPCIYLNDKFRFIEHVHVGDSINSLIRIY